MDKSSNIFSILKPYKGFVALLAFFTIAGNGVSLLIPKLISRGIDSYTQNTFDGRTLSIEFGIVALCIFAFTYLQGIFQTWLAEKAARDIRGKLADKISRFSYSGLEKETRAKLLTNLTSDVDAVKLFISMAVVNIIASAIVIVGASALLLSIDWKLALAVLALLPLIGVVFTFAFKRLRPLFLLRQEIVDRINAVINESIIGASLIRVLHSEKRELEKFDKENTEAKVNGMRVLKLFSIMIPTVGIVANLSTLVILALGGHFVISGTMTLGDFTAFNSYVFILIFPIVVLGFVSNIISSAQASYARIGKVFGAEEESKRGEHTATIRGGIEVKNVSLSYGEKHALKDVSFVVKPGTKTAIIGPTAAGKTQLLYILIGLLSPDKGTVLFDGKAVKEYSLDSFHSQVAIVFQDSVMFNMSLRDNVGFSLDAKEESVKKAIAAAELSDFVGSLPQGLDTIVSERGTSLSGGQKQRVMLARALALEPKVLFLDDFTARVDASTEKKILENVATMYPEMTIVSVTQKIRSIEHFDEIVVLMEGELVAKGTHEELSALSPEYNQIVESQKSTQTYE